MLSMDTESRTAEVDAQVRDYLSTRYPALPDLSSDTPLLEGGAIDSLGILELMTFLSERFGIPIEDTDFSRQNLATPGHLARFIAGRMGH